MFDIYELIAKHEGLRLKPYRCTSGRYTIGFGRNLDARGISYSTAVSFLIEDIEDCKKQAFDIFPRTWEKLNPARKAVVISMLYTLGKTGFLKFELFIKNVNRQNWKQASKEMKNSKWYLQARNRVNDLAYIMESGEFIG